MIVNQQFGWFWILLGFISGGIIGLKFHDEYWLGGYSSHPRRFVRLGHISFIGLGIINILFALSENSLHLPALWMNVTTFAFLVGGITMPLSCFISAFRSGFNPLFVIPVVALMMGGILVLFGVM